MTGTAMRRIPAIIAAAARREKCVSRATNAAPDAVMRDDATPAPPIPSADRGVSACAAPVPVAATGSSRRRKRATMRTSSIPMHVRIVVSVPSVRGVVATKNAEPAAAWTAPVRRAGGITSAAPDAACQGRVPSCKRVTVMEIASILQLSASTARAASAGTGSFFHRKSAMTGIT